jgi:hypothetical protein
MKLRRNASAAALPVTLQQRKYLRRDRCSRSVPLPDLHFQQGCEEKMTEANYKDRRIVDSPVVVSVRASHLRQALETLDARV